MSLMRVDQRLTAEQEQFDSLMSQVERTVAPTSNRVYQQTYRLWKEWCHGQQLSPFDLRPIQVVDFLASRSSTKTTRQRQLSAMRKLAQLLYILKPGDATRAMYEGLKIAKAPTPDVSVTTKERSRRALSAAQADKVLRVWDGNTPTDKRNRALVAVLFLSGVRRSEAAALLWADVNLDDGIVLVRHGKGDKSRTVPLVGESVIDALRTWKEIQGEGRNFIFCAIRKGEHIGQDKPISGTDVYRIVKATESISGIEFKPHDARRTFITEALETGAPLKTVQGAAGHSRPETTLIYAQQVDAKEARKQLKLRYG